MAHDEDPHQYELLGDLEPLAAPDELFVWRPAPRSRWRLVRKSIVLAAAVAIGIGAWVGRGHQSTTVAQPGADTLADYVHLAKDADAAEQRAVLQHTTLLKWNPPLETSSVVRDITNSTNP